MFVSQEHALAEIVNPETDEELINHEFTTKPDSEVGLLVTNLARPDGFVKSLICGSLVTSEELVEKIGKGFVRTHRGYYKSFPPSVGQMTNSDLSFRIGLGQRMYAETQGGKTSPWLKGLGVAIPAGDIIDLPNFSVTYGHYGAEKIADKIKVTGPQTELEKKIISMTEDELDKFDLIPPKSDLLEITHLARRANLMNENRDQGEVQLEPFNTTLPRFDLQNTVILIPAESKEAFFRLVRIKLHECQEYAQELMDTFGIDIRSMTEEDVIQKYPNIYWYPQKNIGQAIKYLTTHPQEVQKIRGIIPD